MIECPACGVVQELAFPRVVNPARTSALCEQIRAGTFGHCRCVCCNASFKAERPLWYMDVPSHRVIRCYPAASEGQWRWLESEPVRIWRRVVDIAPPALRIDAERGYVRVVFGLAALREKLICLEHSIDDRVLEAYKLDLCRSVGADPDLRTRPRLVAASGGQLAIAIPRTAASGRRGADRLATAPIAVLERISRDRSPWTAVLDSLSAGPYVDLGRLLPADRAR